MKIKRDRIYQSRRELVVNTVGNYHALSDGVAVVVRALVKTFCENELGVDACVLTMMNKEDGDAISFDSRSTTLWRTSRSFLSDIESHELSMYGKRVVLHDHGQWLRINRASAKSARQSGFKRIVSPHGMLSPWAMNHKSIKKKLAWFLFGFRNISSSSLVHATSELELSELRNLGITVPICIIPNGVDIPKLAYERRVLGEKPYVLFMSRIHEKKGIRELIEAWNHLGTTGWNLIIAGPDEQNLLKNMRLKENVEFIGPIDGEQKARMLQQASLFVLPTHSENFGLVIAEAMASGTPVITTTNSPWGVLNEMNCGWWIDLTVSNLIETLRAAMNKDPKELESMGLVGREYVVNNFNWVKVAERFSDFYKALINNSELPSHVHRV